MAVGVEGVVGLQKCSSLGALHVRRALTTVRSGHDRVEQIVSARKRGLADTLRRFCSPFTVPWHFPARQDKVAQQVARHPLATLLNSPTRGAPIQPCRSLLTQTSATSPDRLLSDRDPPLTRTEETYQSTGDTKNKKNIILGRRTTRSLRSLYLRTLHLRSLCLRLCLGSLYLCSLRDCRPTRPTALPSMPPLVTTIPLSRSPIRMHARTYGGGINTCKTPMGIRFNRYTELARAAWWGSGS